MVIGSAQNPWIRIIHPDFLGLQPTNIRLKIYFFINLWVVISRSSLN